MRPMHLIQILLPLYKKGGGRVSRALLRSTAKQLAQEFGGVTAYTRAPAQGLWRRNGAKLDRDDIVVYEVMAPTVDPVFGRRGDGRWKGISCRMKSWCVPHGLCGYEAGTSVRCRIRCGDCGGGTAGLSAALILGRCARRVLICDDGTPRSWAAHHVHGFLTRDGEGQDEFRALGRQQLRRYRNVQFRVGQVSKISPTAARFVIRVVGTTAISARKVLLATGVFDNLPSIPGIEAYFGKTALPCPYCDGWEMRGKAISVYGRGARGFEMARALGLLR